MQYYSNTLDRINLRLCSSRLNLSLFLIYGSDMVSGYFSITFFYDYMNFPSSIAAIVQLHLWIIRKKVALPLEDTALQGQMAWRANPRMTISPHLPLVQVHMCSEQPAQPYMKNQDMVWGICLNQRWFIFPSCYKFSVWLQVMRQILQGKNIPKNQSKVY